MRTVAVVGVLMLSPHLCCQRLYLGAMAGTGLTNDFPPFDSRYPGDSFGNPPSDFQHLAGPRSLILGALVEVRLIERFSIEANVLHRPLRDTLILSEFPAGGPTTATNNTYTAAQTWEFPVMLKWSGPPLRAGRRFRPFVEGGVSFRSQQDTVAVQPSQVGVTVGAGVGFQTGAIRVAPTLRYTRWEKETRFPPYPTKPDQLEFLTSVSWGAETESLHVAGHRLGLGVVAGLGLSAELQDPYGGVSEKTRYLAGVATEFDLCRGVALEVNGIYKPLRSGKNDLDRFSVLTWQFPVLAKHRWRRRRYAPFVDAGPSFRIAGNLNGYNPSHFGITAGGGLEMRAGGARVSPGMRYTRWEKDAYPYRVPAGVHFPYAHTNANAVELVFEVGF
jgi:hypothetical protein